MRKFILPLAALALVAGCKGKEPEAVATDAAATASEAAVALPALPENAKATVKPEGTYTAGAAKLMLAADMNAEMTDAAGKATTGKWAWYSDGKRIVFSGDKSVWAVADGALYKLASKDAPLTGMTADQVWTKAM
ncbi:hypothetical protein [Novosphingobium sp.]|uniref:hypothetical protein n=1 Tax=Novosphingobium sp. TaxID=1874826 RepID=UPI00286CCB8F|nr:hypothetical protein [Novosphingobium sp.]